MQFSLLFAKVYPCQSFPLYGTDESDAEEQDVDDGNDDTVHAGGFKHGMRSFRKVVI